MAIVDRYLAYADAFEKSFVDDDWSRIAPFFTDDAVYETVFETDETAHGNAAVLAKLKRGIDAFDRKMDSRTLTLGPPSVDGDSVTVKWRVVYEREGCPDLEISGTEIADFEGDRIKRLYDEFDPEAAKATNEWMAAHGAALQG
jgi:hypothetical protein